MKKYQIVLAVLAAVLVCCSGISGTLAYFSDRDTGTEVLPVVIDNNPEIDEKFDGEGNKIVTIKNNGAAAVFVRFKVEASENVTVSMSGENWSTASALGLAADNDYLYYAAPLAGGATASAVTVTVKLPTYTDQEAAHKAGEEAHVAVLYESVPAVYNEEGLPDLVTAWARGTVTVIG